MTLLNGMDTESGAGPDTWLRPTVAQLEQGNLVIPRGQEWRTIRAGREMFDAFIRLSTAPDIAIRDFALQWGTLVLCRERGWPTTHSPGLLIGMGNCAPRLEGDAYWTRLDEWRRYAATARALERIASSIRYGKVASEADVDAVAQQHSWALSELLGVQEHPESRLARQRQQLVTVIGVWAHLGGVRPRLFWEGDGARIVLSGEPGPEGFFGALVVQLMLATTDTREMISCSYCGRPYVPKKRPKPGLNHYCPDCGPSRAQSEAQKRLREKRRKEQQ